MNSSVKMLAMRIPDCIYQNRGDEAVLEIKAPSRVFNIHTFVHIFLASVQAKVRKIKEKDKTRLGAFEHSDIIW